MKEEPNDLEAIKKLLALQLRHQGVPDTSIAKAMGIKPKTIRNLFPLGKRPKGEKKREKKD